MTKKNNFETLCDELEKNYDHEINQITYTRTYLTDNITGGLDDVLRIQAEAQSGDYVSNYSFVVSMSALLFAIMGGVAQLFFDIGKPFIGASMLTVGLVFITVYLYKINRFNSVNRWRAYVLQVIAELIEKSFKQRESGEEENLNEDDVRTIKAVAAILEIMAGSEGTVKYTGEALGMLSEDLMKIVDRLEMDN